MATLLFVSGCGAGPDAGGPAGEGDAQPGNVCLDVIPEPILVAAGPFKMGCDSFGDDVPCYADETPEHTVILSAYRIDAVEVTVNAYRACVEAGACTEPTDLSNGDCNYPQAERGAYPVNCLAWSQADTYCRWSDGRLPTEAEWEKAARGQDARRFPWGDELPTCLQANFSGCHPSSRPVGCFPAGRSASGAWDMAGNVAEYVNDWYQNTWYRESSDVDPTGPETGEHRVTRGGSYYDFDHFQRATFRGGHDPSERPFDYIGFRCAYDVE